MKTLILILALALPVVATAASTQRREPVTTSQFTRQALTNETSSGWRLKLGIGTNGVSYDLTYSTNLPWTGLDAAARAMITNIAVSSSGTNSGTANALTNNDTRAVTINNFTSSALTAGSVSAGTVTASAGFYGSGAGLTAIPGSAIVANSISNTQIAYETISTNHITDAFYEWLISASSAGALQAVNNLTDVASLSQSRTNLGANNANNITAGTVALPRLPTSVVTNNNTVSNSFFGAFTGNGAGLSNLTAAVTADSNILAQANSYTVSNSPISGTLNEYRMRVPPRIWGSWNDFPNASTYSWDNSTNVTERYMMELVGWWKTNGMLAAGWKYIVLEEGWQDGWDASGNLVVNTNKFPSGLTNLFTYIRTNGFIPGIYTSVSANNPSLTCEGWAGTCYTNINAHFQQFANWGAEFVFVDVCSGYNQWTDVPNGLVPNTADALYQQRINIINQAINQTGKSMSWLNVTPLLSPLGRFTPRAYSQQNITFTGPESGDRWDFIPTVPMADIFQRTATNSANFWREHTRPGHYFYQGLLSKNMVKNDYRAGFLLQTMTGGAMFIDSGTYHIYSAAGSPTTNSYPYTGPYANPPSTWDSEEYNYSSYKTNQELAAIHQDPAVVPANLIWSNGLAQVWAKPLGQSEFAKDYALLFVNSSTTNRTITLPFSLFARSNSIYSFRDVVAMTNWDTFTNSVAITVTPTNTMLYRVAGANPARKSAVFPNNISVNEGGYYGASVLIGGAPNNEGLYSGLWFTANSIDPSYENMGVGGQANGMNWLNSVTNAQIRVLNLPKVNVTSTNITANVPILSTNGYGFGPPSTVISNWYQVTNFFTQIGGGGSQTPWLTDIQASSNSLYEVKYIYGSSNIAALLLGASPLLGDSSISLFRTNASSQGIRYYSPTNGHTFDGPVTFNNAIAPVSISTPAATITTATIETANIETNNTTEMVVTNFIVLNPWNAVKGTNIPVTALWGSGGTNTSATNGTAGQVFTSSGNGGGYWNTVSGFGTYSNVYEQQYDTIVRSNFTIQGLFVSGITATGQTAFTFAADKVRIPDSTVPTIRPYSTNNGLMVDIMPNGRPATALSAGLDIVDRDLWGDTTTNAGFWRVVRMSIYTNGTAYIGTIGWGGATNSTPQALNVIGGTRVAVALTTNDQDSAVAKMWFEPTQTWSFNPIVFSPNNTYDIGSASYKPRTVYAATSVVASSNTIAGGSSVVNGVTLPGNGKIQAGSMWIGGTGENTWVYNHLQFSANNTIDVGQPSYRPRYVYAATGILGGTNDGFTVNASGDTGARTLSPTNGVVLIARDTIPTNSIPASTSTATNWVLINWTNTGPVFIATNLAAAGSFLTRVPTTTLGTWP